MKYMPATLLSLSLLATPFAALAEPVTKDEFGPMVKEYLRNNPEAIIEALELFKQQQEEASKDESRAAIEDYREKLYHDPMTPAIGDKDAEVTIVEFFDYNCSACKYMFKPIDALVEDGLDDIRIIFKEYPIFGEKSEKLSRIGLAVYAIEPDAYYEFHSKLMTHEGKLSAAQAYEYAKELGVGRETLVEELSKPKYSQSIEETKELARDLKVRGTPFLIVGGEPVPHAVDQQTLDSHIARAREAAAGE